MGREDIFKSTIWNESPYQVGNDNGVRILNFATSRILVVNSMMFPHRTVRNYIWTCPDGKTHKQIDHILIDRRWHSSILDVLSFRGADCGTDHYLVVAKVRERFDGEKYNLRKLNELEVRKHYQIGISNRFATLKNLHDSEDINRAWENIKQDIRISAKESLGLHELKLRVPWFHEKCLGF